jgi:hypothetical protein
MLARSAPVEAVEELPAALDDNFLNGLDFPSITNRDHAEKMLLAINARIAWVISLCFRILNQLTT